MASLTELTPVRRGVLASLLFLVSGAMAGVRLVDMGTQYRVFGLVEGVFAIFLVYLFVSKGAWRAPLGVVGWLTMAYGAWATAQILELLLPPPGLLEWVTVSGLALTSWAALGAVSRRRLLSALVTLAMLLALLNFSVIPILWTRAGPAPGEAFGIGNLAEGLRQLVVAYQPIRPGSELLGVFGIALWALATRLLWPDPRERSPRFDDRALTSSPGGS